MSNGSFGHNIAFNRWWRRRTPVDATPRTPADATPRTPTDAAPRTPADADRRQAGRRAQRRRCHARVKLAARRRWSWARGCKVLTEGCRAFRFQTTGSSHFLSRNGQGSCQNASLCSYCSIQQGYARHLLSKRLDRSDRRKEQNIPFHLKKKSWTIQFTKRMKYFILP